MQPLANRPHPMLHETVSGERKIRSFCLSTTFLEDFHGKQPKWGFGGLGYFTYLRTYSRVKPDGTSEEFWETCQRVVEGCFNIQKIHCRQNGLPWNEPKAQKSAQDMFLRMWEFKFLPPGRGLWMMGTDMVYEKGSASLQNCAFISSKDVDEDFASPFCFLMDMSMLGVGTGGDTRGAGKVKLRKPDMTDVPFVVEDSREGWVALTRTVLNSFTGKVAYPTVVDYSKVRPRGALIKGFGGIASGAAPLKHLTETLTKLLMPEGVSAEFYHDGETVAVEFTGSGQPTKVTSTQIVDTFNAIGACVVAGGLRRTAEVMLGDAHDEGFRKLKDPTELNALMAQRAALKDLPGKEDEVAKLEHAIANHPLRTMRWASNNSVFAHVGMDYSSLVPAIAANGEPGLFWIQNAQRFSRMGDPPDDKDYRVLGANPCMEQPLESREMCNLVESFPAHHDSLEDFKRTLKMAYLYAKTVTLLPSHDPRSNAVAMRNRRIGCSMSGIVQAVQKFGRREFFRWCDDGYHYLQSLDKLYSEWLCVPRSIKMSTIKPAGTTSLLAGATPGMHHPHSQFYIRRVRVANTSPLVEACRQAGYPVEPDSYAADTSVVSFPVKEEHFAKGKADVTIWEQFSLAAALQQYWSDNMVSVTVTVQPHEVKDIQACLEMHETKLKSVSLLPLTTHGYVQAPYETIDETTYLALMAKITPLGLGASPVHDLDAEEKFCTTDACEIRARG